MPELPEVETIVRELDASLRQETLGRTILTRTDIVHGNPQPLAALLRGRRVERVHRRAKRIIMELSAGTQLIFHLGMSGRLTLNDMKEPVGRHTHLRIAIRNFGRELRFCDPRRFGGVWCFTNGGDRVGRKLGELGPEPLSLNRKPFRTILTRRRSIKPLLMDQGMIAGLGNIYCDEALHAARIHPLTPAQRLDAADADRLLRAIKRILRSAIRSKGSTLVDYRRANGERGAYQLRHRVYQREAKPCKTCGCPILRIRVGGRSTFFCPQCQPEQIG